MSTRGAGPVRMRDLGREPDAIELLATAMEELAVAQALVMIHGEARGLLRYREAGGRVWFDADGEPVIWRRP